MMSNVLTLREYESASIGEVWDAPAKTVTAQHASQLEQLQRRTGQAVFDIGRHSIKATNYVGTVALGDNAIEILPKTDLTNNETRQRLIEMLAVTQLIPFREVDIADQAIRSATLLDVFMSVYLDHLKLQWRRGHVASYRKVDANRTCLKGKLLFSDHVRKNIAHAERFYTRCDTFTVDVPISQTLKLATNICRRYATRHSISQDAFGLLMEFDEVSDVRLGADELQCIQTNRQTQRFSSVLGLAKRLILGESPDRSAANRTFSLLFDMNLVFERYIAKLLSQALWSEEIQVSAQIGGKHLVRREGRGRFRLNPDVGIYKNRKLMCLVDTKWKLLDRSRPHEGVSQADMYQMYAYAREYGAPHVILLYPQLSDFPGEVADYHLRTDENLPSFIKVRTINIRQSPLAVKKELETLLGWVTSG